MISGRCPICSKTFEIAKLDDLPSFPFCCERCRLVDIGRWIDGAYVIPGRSAAPAPADSGESDEADTNGE
jgi:endogenous inhibitor of DNA gyrase (YacG/DUF329 family)